MNFNIIIIEDGVTTNEIENIDQQSLTSWLITRELMTESETLYSFNELQPWKMGGAETYYTIFNFKTDKQEQTVVVKIIREKERFVIWRNRKNLLLDNNVPVSHWFWTDADKATIFEPFYPYKSNKTKDFNLLLQIAFTLDNLGFATLNFLDDIMCDIEGNPFYIDFGSDLGGSSQYKRTNAKDFLKKIYPSRRTDIETFYNTNS